MRLVSCNTKDHNGITDATIDFDKIVVIKRNIDDKAIIAFENGYQETTDIPYENAIEIWEKYKPKNELEQVNPVFIRSSELKPGY